MESFAHARAQASKAQAANAQIDEALDLFYVAMRNKAVYYTHGKNLEQAMRLEERIKNAEALGQADERRALLRRQAKYLPRCDKKCKVVRLRCAAVRHLHACEKHGVYHVCGDAHFTARLEHPGLTIGTRFLDRFRCQHDVGTGADAHVCFFSGLELSAARGRPIEHVTPLSLAKCRAQPAQLGPPADEVRLTKMLQNVSSEATRSVVSSRVALLLANRPARLALVDYLRKRRDARFLEYCASARRARQQRGQELTLNEALDFYYTTSVDLNFYLAWQPASDNEQATVVKAVLFLWRIVLELSIEQRALSPRLEVFALGAIYMLCEDIVMAAEPVQRGQGGKSSLMLSRQRDVMALLNSRMGFGAVTQTLATTRVVVPAIRWLPARLPRPEHLDKLYELAGQPRAARSSVEAVTESVNDLLAATSPDTIDALLDQVC